MKIYTGINIQYPISRIIMEKSKTIETRTYPIPAKYIGKELLFIETPGKEGNFKARVVGTIKFGSCFLYKSKADFYKDIKKHKVGRDSPYAWKDKPKWGWIIESVKLFKKPITAPKKKGIIFTTGISKAWLSTHS
jgi:hypothetical protein